MSDSINGKPLNEDDYIYLRNNLNTNIILNYDHLMTELNYSHSGIYNNIIYKTGYCKVEDLTLIAGAFPADEKKIMITDYTADGHLLNNDLYKSYSDIISKGIYTETAYFQVSGIIDTDYEKYIPVYDDMSFNQSRSIWTMITICKTNMPYSTILMMR